MPKLANKKALVTGGARGIGAAIARCFATEGAEVIIADIDVDTGPNLAAELGGAFFELDVSSEAAWTALATTHPAVDILVNNAGITGFEDSQGPHDPEHASLAEWHRDAGQRLGLDYQYVVALGHRRHSGRSGLCFVEGGNPQPHQIGCAILRATRPEYPLQLDPPRRHPNADVGSVDR